MPWKESSVVNESVGMISDWLQDEYTITDLSNIYGISRKTAYKWIERFKTDGPKGLERRSSAPLSHPNAYPAEIIQGVIQAKLKHQCWGPRKLRRWLNDNCGKQTWPCVSTIGDMLKKEGLVRSRKRRKRAPVYREGFNVSDRPNAVWCADYKGQFRTQDQKPCYPLTITDNYSRYLILCRGLEHPSHAETQPWFEWAFREYGLPEALRTDNGTPFASAGLGGLSKLSVWLIKLGIKPERIDPGHPEQNGRHERMHRTLKEAATTAPQNSLREQQGEFDAFVAEYNLERPHEALGLNTPSSFYEPSTRSYPAKVPEVVYDDDAQVRRVRHNGEIKWQGRKTYISEALVGEPIGLWQIDNHLWELKFSFHPLGILDEKTGRIKTPKMCNPGARLNV